MVQGCQSAQHNSLFRAMDLLTPESALFWHQLAQGDRLATEGLQRSLSDQHCLELTSDDHLYSIKSNKPSLSYREHDSTHPNSPRRGPTPHSMTLTRQSSKMDSTEAKDGTRLAEWLLNMQEAPHVKRYRVGTLEMGASNHKLKVVLIDMARVQDQHKQR